MKKIYLLLIFLLGNIYLQAQIPACQYDYNWLALGKTGVWPDSAANFVSGTVGVPYTQNVTIRVPDDTTASIFGPPQTLHFDRIELANPAGYTNYGLPSGLSLVCTPSSCKFPGNDTSCMIIYGTPTTAGTYNLGFKLTTYVQEIPNVAVNTSTLTYYKIVIGSSNGINNSIPVVFGLYQNIPNPSETKTLIKYNLPTEGKVKLSIYNTLGKLVFEKKTEGIRGENDWELSTRDFSSGLYMYSIEYNGKVLTRRMVVARY